ncbi:hypothetical protein DYB25_004236 [Aphanomyces astaci]|uniref:Ribosomal RNA-processing protein 14/surfeit locus protein 6 C-terminal domain-containing protein n=1 Tax=Aphanomyces astaci TaxID=112090 RepID=A0A397EPZ4_APHAT|nr:hypothetical protein DYB25_004236 [Aphanomyces astaci]RHY39751.1 hypothetical protein DYB30_005028 [Aphanomyces astaci]RHY50627.1 hypothetical protein DYB38_001590 [Aphanomyces astaci]RHY59810.1 hypothetical protein DYB34_005157 [Aphanomyces astaci]RHY92198.1 hypothetical protein DYB31_003697 [Aphanomyces astaci]
MALEVAAVDRFFCNVMELIPSAHYFPTEPEDNFKHSINKKYHKNVKALSAAADVDITDSKHVGKRLKFNPKLQLSNEATQVHEKEKETKRVAATADDDDDDNVDDASLTGLDGLRKRLAKRIETMRVKRQSVKEHKTSKKEHTKDGGADKSAASKKRKPSTSQDKSQHKKAKGNNDDDDVPTTATTTLSSTSSNAESNAATDVATAKTVDESISYGSLLVGHEKKEEAKTRNGRGLANIQNLLKKAEAKKARMEELKKTEEGRAVVAAKGWEKALKQAQGDKVMDDPKLLRNKLKKKLKQKDKSSKEWYERILSFYSKFG